MYDLINKIYLIFNFNRLHCIISYLPFMINGMQI